MTKVTVRSLVFVLLLSLVPAAQGCAASPTTFTAKQQARMTPAVRAVNAVAPAAGK